MENSKRNPKRFNGDILVFIQVDWIKHVFVCKVVGFVVILFEDFLFWWWRNTGNVNVWLMDFDRKER